MHTADSFDAVYRHSYARLVAELAVVTLSRPSAEDAVQEAFSRAWSNWTVIGTLDQPDAWVRKTAVNFAVSRWRRQRVARKHEASLLSQETYEIPTDTVDLIRGLQRLPPKVRAALVLTAVVGMTAEEVAAALGAQPATVRSWLHRGRQAFLNASPRDWNSRTGRTARGHQ